jgi:hypothetical protein
VGNSGTGQTHTSYLCEGPDDGRGCQRTAKKAIGNTLLEQGEELNS